MGFRVGGVGGLGLEESSVATWLSLWGSGLGAHCLGLGLSLSLGCSLGLVYIRSSTRAAPELHKAEASPEPPQSSRVSALGLQGLELTLFGLRIRRAVKV